MDWTYIDDVLVDLVENESSTFSNEVTQKPIEDGTVISDHINNQPTTFSLDIIITGEYGGTPEEKYERLLAIRDNREIISVIGALQVYENMAISEISLQKSSDNAKGYSGSITFQQVRYAKAETITVNIAPPKLNGENLADPEGESSEISTKDSENENVDQETIDNKSLANKLLEILRPGD
ncbi:MAG: hypothetical protein K9K76_09730 [Halanaerobiales bacterium]|nr:hypothetical protein [Halanaerobiales bacterium]